MAEKETGIQPTLSVSKNSVLIDLPSPATYVDQQGKERKLSTLILPPPFGDCSFQETNGPICGNCPMTPKRIIEMVSSIQSSPLELAQLLKRANCTYIDMDLIRKELYPERVSNK